MKKIGIIAFLLLFLLSCNLGGDRFIGKWRHRYGGIDQFGDGAYIRWLVIVKWGNEYKVSYHYGGNTNPPFIDFVATAEYKDGALVLDHNIEIPEGYADKISNNNDTLFYNGEKYYRVPDEDIRNGE